jgi:hypothetical protein
MGIYTIVSSSDTTHAKGDPVELTDEDLAPYIGGQLDARDARSHWRGEITSISFDSNGHLQVILAWTAKDDGYPRTTRWVKDDEPPFNGIDFNLEGSTTSRHEGRLIIDTTRHSNAIVTLFLPGAEELISPSEVQGLVLPPH